MDPPLIAQYDLVVHSLAGELVGLCLEIERIRIILSYRQRHDGIEVVDARYE